jgi:hypothetical protein
MGGAQVIDFLLVRVVDRCACIDNADQFARIDRFYEIRNIVAFELTDE